MLKCFGISALRGYENREIDKFANKNNLKIKELWAATFLAETDPVLIEK